MLLGKKGRERPKIPCTTALENSTCLIISSHSVLLRWRQPGNQPIQIYTNQKGTSLLQISVCTWITRPIPQPYSKVGGKSKVLGTCPSACRTHGRMDGRTDGQRINLAALRIAGNARSRVDIGRTAPLTHSVIAIDIGDAHYSWMRALAFAVGKSFEIQRH